MVWRRCCIGRQFGERTETISHLLVSGEQFIQDLGVRVRGRMQQHDRSVVDAGDELFKRLLGGRLVVGIPIHIGQTPKDGRIAQRLSLFEIFLAVFALGRTVELGQLLSGQGLELFLHAAQFLFKGRRIGDLRHIRMGRGVVADQMAFGDHAFDQIGRAFDIVADHKEAGGRLMLFQRIQNGCRVAAFIPGIEGEV